MRRIWRRKDLQTTMTNAEAITTNIAANVAEQGAHVAPEKTSSKKTATRKKGAPKGHKLARGAKAKAAKKATAGKTAPAPRADSKGAKILDMIARGRKELPWPS